MRLRCHLQVVLLCAVAMSMIAASAPAFSSDDSSIASASSAAALLRRCNYDEALKQYRSLLKANPADPDAHAGLIRALLKKEKVEEAWTAAQAALALLPDSAAIHSAAGEVQF